MCQAASQRVSKEKNTRDKYFGAKTKSYTRWERPMRTAIALKLTSGSLRQRWLTAPSCFVTLIRRFASVTPESDSRRESEWASWERKRSWPLPTSVLWMKINNNIHTHSSKGSSSSRGSISCRCSAGTCRRQLQLLLSCLALSLSFARSHFAALLSFFWDKNFLPRTHVVAVVAISLCETRAICLASLCGRRERGAGYEQ